MDALKFLQTAKRICNAKCDKNMTCTNCCLHDLCNDFLCYCSDQTFTKIISTVEQYAKDHPAKETRKDRLLRCFPNLLTNGKINENGDVDLCPEYYLEDSYCDTETRICDKYADDCAICKHEYWSEEPHGSAYWDKYWEEDHGR